MSEAELAAKYLPNASRPRSVPGRESALLPAAPENLPPGSAPRDGAASARAQSIFHSDSFSSYFVEYDNGSASTGAQPLTLKQTLPGDWNGLMTLSWSGATAYWTPTGGTPIVSGSVFSNALLPQTIYLEGDGCGMNEAVFSVVGLSDCKTNAALNVFGMNATLDGVAELEELAPGGFIADCSVHADAIRSQLSLEACGPYGAPGNVVLSWSPSLVQLYPSATGGSPLSQYIVPYAGFTGATFYVEGVALGSTTLGWTYSEQSDCADEIKVTILKVEFKTNELIRPLHEQTLDAETWLTDDTFDKTRITWTITKVEGVTATIDQDGDITYGQGSGIYTIRAESSDLST